MSIGKYEILVQQTKAEKLPDNAKSFLEGYIMGVLQSNESERKATPDEDPKPEEKEGD